VQHAREHLAVTPQLSLVDGSLAIWHYSEHLLLLTLKPEVLRLQAAGGIWAGILIVLTNVALRAVFLCFDYYAALALSTMGMHIVWAGGKNGCEQCMGRGGRMGVNSAWAGGARMGVNSVWAGGGEGENGCEKCMGRGEVAGSRLAIRISSLHYSPRTERYHATAAETFSRAYFVSA
jgi:hypothetical protein